MFRTVNGGRGRIFGVEPTQASTFRRRLAGLDCRRTTCSLKATHSASTPIHLVTRGDDLKNDVPDPGRIPPVFSKVSMRYSAMYGKIYIEPYMNIVGRQDQYAPGSLR